MLLHKLKAIKFYVNTNIFNKHIIKKLIIFKLIKNKKYQCNSHDDKRKLQINLFRNNWNIFLGRLLYHYKSKVVTSRLIIFRGSKQISVNKTEKSLSLYEKLVRNCEMATVFFHVRNSRWTPNSNSGKQFLFQKM